MNRNYAQPFFEQSKRTPDHLALTADGVSLTYGELAFRVARLAGVLRDRGIEHGSLVAILGSRSLIAIEAVLATAWSGAAYVPLGVGWPEDRLRTVMDRCGVRTVIADARGQEALTPALSDAAEHVLRPETIDTGEASATLDEPAKVTSEALAYIIFTSGTTGVPKGVMATTGSLRAYVDALASRKEMTPADRASQFTELSFDPSIGEILVPLEAGASLHVVPAISKVSPARFIRDSELTIWGSAPAAIAWMRATRSLRPGSLPGLRYTSFGGEPLPLESVRAWQAAAPNSVIDNLYGPTEATVDCVGQTVAPGAEPVVTPGRGTLAIGTPHPGSELAVLGPDRRFLDAEEVGELAIAGLQLTKGYLDEPALTAERFPWIEGKRWYLTGDRALRDLSGLYHHMGRLDHQIKFHGHRVELEDIEAHLRSISGAEQVAVVAWPFEDGVARAIIAFLAPSAMSESDLRAGLRERLPAHMVPSAIHVLTTLPVGANGKIDRQALISLLEVDPPEDR